VTLQQVDDHDLPLAVADGQGSIIHATAADVDERCVAAAGRWQLLAARDDAGLDHLSRTERAHVVTKLGEVLGTSTLRILGQGVVDDRLRQGGVHHPAADLPAQRRAAVVAPGLSERAEGPTLFGVGRADGNQPSAGRGQRGLHGPHQLDVRADPALRLDLEKTTLVDDRRDQRVTANRTEVARHDFDPHPVPQLKTVRRLPHDLLGEQRGLEDGPQVIPHDSALAAGGADDQHHTPLTLRQPLLVAREAGLVGTNARGHPRLA